MTHVDEVITRVHHEEWARVVATLAMEVRVALTLRMVGGLTVPEIAHAFLVQETAMARRITRAKAKIKATKIPYGVPLREDLPARVTGVLAVLYLIFNEGYLASDPEKEAVRGDLTAEAIRLTTPVTAYVESHGSRHDEPVPAAGSPRPVQPPGGRANNPPCTAKYRETE